MIAFPGLLVNPAKQAGMKIPKDIDNFDWIEFPHFAAFINYQIGRKMPAPTSHWHNAKIIAKIPDNEIMEVTFKDLTELGFM